jgi:hypothetical protein
MCGDAAGSDDLTVLDTIGVADCDVPTRTWRVCEDGDGGPQPEIRRGGAADENVVVAT